MIKPIDTNYHALMPNGFFSRAHELGAAIYFYLWCVARTTREVVYDDDETRYGSVVGGKPVCVEDIGPDFPQVTGYTLNDWRKTCVKAGIIRTKRAPHGNIIEVIGSCKFSDKTPERRKTWQKPKNKDVGKNQHHFHEVENDMGNNPQDETTAESCDLQNSNIVICKKPISQPRDIANSQIYIEVKGFEVKEGKRKENRPHPSISNSKPSGAAKGKTLTITEKTQIEMMRGEGMAPRTIAARLEVPDILVDEHLATLESQTSGVTA